MLSELGHLAETRLTPKGEFAASLFGFELLLTELHADGVLENLNETELSVLISSFVFEPRKGDQPANLSGANEKLLKLANHYHRQIHKWEVRYQILPYTKMPHFHLAPTVESWMRGDSFDKICRHTSIDEGELVRYFRMIIQLLRELLHAPHTSEKLKRTAHIARDKINRDVVDAERQLRV
jgi:superfamily II RNA helicase